MEIKQSSGFRRIVTVDFDKLSRLGLGQVNDNDWHAGLEIKIGEKLL